MLGGAQDQKTLWSTFPRQTDYWELINEFLCSNFYLKMSSQLRIPFHTLWPNETVRARLAERGLKLNHQRIPAIFRNPFYCGLIVHNMLEGKVVNDNHDPIIPKDVFLKVNGLLDKTAYGYTINEENDALPLKRFLHCECCRRPMRGYIVQKKKIYYYKCNTKGCGNNKSAKKPPRKIC